MAASLLTPEGCTPTIPTAVWQWASRGWAKKTTFDLSLARLQLCPRHFFRRNSVLFEDASDAAGPNYAVVIRRVDGGLPIRLGDGSSGSLSLDGKWSAAFPIREPDQNGGSSDG